LILGIGVKLSLLLRAAVEVSYTHKIVWLLLCFSDGD